MSASWTTLRVLTWTAERFTREGLESARLDAEVLLAHCLGGDRLRLYVEHEKPLAPDELARCRRAIRRRLAREPVAYITGMREFWSLPLAVSPAVLIPRPETEVLVERAIALLGELPLPSPVLVDVGTGSGAIAIALATEAPQATVYGLDIERAALDVAEANASRLGARACFCQGDLLDALPADARAPDLVVANLPYVASAELGRLQPEVARWEPRQALDGGADGLDLIRRLVRQAAGRLAPGRALALEIGCEQAAAVRRLLSAEGFRRIEVLQDLGARDRVVSAWR